MYQKQTFCKMLSFQTIKEKEKRMTLSSLNESFQCLGAQERKGKKVHCFKQQAERSRHQLKGAGTGLRQKTCDLSTGLMSCASPSDTSSISHKYSFLICGM